MDTLAEYLDYYGFKSEPFVGKGSFFATAERSEVLDQVEHWCDFGAGIIVVEGAPGVGKTALLAELIRRFDDSALVSHLDGPVLAGLDQMLMLLAAELGADLIEGQTSGAMLGYLRKHVKTATQPMYIAVDQAHNLDDRTLLALLSLLQGQLPGEQRLNIIVCAQPGLAERLRSFDVADVIVNDISLGTFDSASLNSYVHQQLLDAAYEGPELFNQMELNELYKASEGVPGKANLLAQNLLINRLYSTSAKAKGFPAWHLVGVGVLLATLATAYVYRADIQALMKPSEQTSAVATSESNEDLAKKENLTEKADLATNEGLAHASPSTDQANTVVKNEALSDAATGSVDGGASSAVEALEPGAISAQSISALDDTENLINEALTPSEPTLEDGGLALNDAIESPAPPGESQQSINQPSIAPGQAAISSAQGSDQLGVTENNDEVVNSSAGRNSGDGPNSSNGEALPGNNGSIELLQGVESIQLADVNEIGDGAVDYSSLSSEQLAQLGMDPAFDLSVFTEDEQYLLRLPDSAYVLQLIAVRTTEQVEKFLRVQANRDQLRIFNRERDGKSWYVIVQPGFDTWESVQAAQDNLPSRQRTGGAWARSLKIIKADIRSFRGI